MSLRAQNSYIIILSGIVVADDTFSIKLYLDTDIMRQGKGILTVER